MNNFWKIILCTLSQYFVQAHSAVITLRLLHIQRQIRSAVIKVDAHHLWRAMFEACRPCKSLLDDSLGEHLFGFLYWRYSNLAESSKAFLTKPFPNQIASFIKRSVRSAMLFVVSATFSLPLSSCFCVSNIHRNAFRLTLAWPGSLAVTICCLDLVSLKPSNGYVCTSSP